MRRDFRIALLIALTGGFVIVAAATAAGLLAGLDGQVAETMGALWQPSLLIPFLGVAVLGGVEVTTLLTVAIAWYLSRTGERRVIPALLSFAAAVLIETLYKKLMFHPGTPDSIAHGNAPSISDLVSSGIGGFSNSFPTGHVTRTVLVYGLIAFVVCRRSASERVRRVAVAGWIALVALMSFDRLYLGVHWDSDVLGGLLLGGASLTAALIWTDQLSEEVTS